MNRHFLVPLLCFSFCIVLWGCGDEAEGCLNSADCESNQICVNGACAARDGTDAGRADSATRDDASLDGDASGFDAGEVDAGPAICGAACETLNPCELGSYDCSGGEPVCEAVGPATAETLCRESAGECDAEERCDGESTACPADARLPADATCRESAGECDIAELCDGESPACPLDRFAPTGDLCGAGFCDGSGVCSDGCTPGAICDPGVPCRRGEVDCATGTPRCQLAGNDVDGTTCNATENGTWGTCSYNGTCDNSGTQSRPVTAYQCDAGICSADVSNENRGCTRDTSGSSCGGGTTYSSWGSCMGFSGTCDTTGTRTRSSMTQTCAGGACDIVTGSQSEACSRTTNGTVCQAVTYGSWSACSGFLDICDTSGTRSRTVTTPTCGSGTCAGVNTTETGGCSRLTNGTSCGMTTYGPWSSCSYSSSCEESGTRTRTQTDQVCSAGACGNQGSTNNGTCSRDTDGNVCPGSPINCETHACFAGTCRSTPTCRIGETCCPGDGCFSGMYCP